MSLCAECDREFRENGDYICDRCRHRMGQKRMSARYDNEGHNQWGTRYHSVCSVCAAEYPSNLYGMGRCTICGTDNNPMDPYAKSVYQ